MQVVSLEWTTKEIGKHGAKPCAGGFVGKEMDMGENNKKQQILRAAVEIMGNRGKDASITEIARVAGVNDSMIYHYFKNKEDLMFHAAGNYIRDRLDEFDHHLQGIREPVSRLSKLMWQQLHYHNDNMNYAKFAIFACRSKKSFFRHEAFGYFLKWAQLLKKILEDGVQEGAFSKNLPVTVARDMILGLLDMENIQFFTGHQAVNPEANFEEILHMVLLMVTDDKDRPEEHMEKRDVILKAAENIFAEKGYDKATTIEIAKAARVSEATLYEYFHNKEDILFSALQYRFCSHLQLTGEVFEIRTPFSKLIRFIYYHFTMYLRQPAFVKTFILDGVFNPRFYKSKAYSDFQNYMAIIDRILDEGKVDGSFRPELNNRIFKNIFLGIFSHTALRWLFVENGRRFEMMGRINEVTSLLMHLAMHPESHDWLPSSALIR